MPEVIARLAEVVRAAGIREADLVGGCVRDALLGRELQEIDVSTSDAPTLAQRAAEALGSRVVALGSAGHPLYRVPFDRGHVDISPRTGTRQEDLAARDFTVNAMAVPLAGTSPGDLSNAADVIDAFDGRADVARRVLRAVRPDVFNADPVRAFRAARLAAELGFTVDREAAAALPSAIPGLAGTARERVELELRRLFAADRSVEGVRILEASGLLEVVFPELAEGYGVEQRPTHTYTVYRHQLVACERLDELLAPSPPEEAEARHRWEVFWAPGRWEDTPWGPLREHLDGHRATLKVATLLHDVGKPRTLVTEEDGRTRFFGHEEVGAAMVGQALARWRFSRALRDRVCLLVEQHLRPGQVASPGLPPTSRALHRFQRALGDATPDVCLLFLADSLAMAPAPVHARWRAYVDHVERIITWRPRPSAAELRRLVDGRAVMEATGLEPGPAVGRLLDAIEEAAAAGEVSDVDGALSLARSLVEQEIRREDVTR